MKIKLSLFLSACCLMGATADDIAVDDFVRESIVATNCDVTVGSIFAAPRAVAIEKTGTNALTVSVNAIQTREPVPVRVLEGTLNVVPGTDPGLEQPACLQRAALWLDAMQADTLVPPDGATGNEVARWYDVRETFADGQWGTNYYCAAAKASFVTNEVSPGVWETVIVYPVKKTALTNGMDYVDFNGKSSGSWMRLLTKARADVGALEFVHHVFYSGCALNAWGYPLGANVNQTVFWHPGNYTALNTFGSQASHPSIFSGTTRWNGVDIDPFSTYVTAGPYLHEWHAAHGLGLFGNFFNDRNIWSVKNGFRCGGDALGEVVVFTNRLSAAERMAVGEYLLRKWTRAARAQELDVSTATNIAVAVASGASAVYAGAGSVQAAAGAEVVYSPKEPAAGKLRVGEGEANVFAGELPFAFEPGDVLSMQQSGYGVLIASNAPNAALAADGSATLSLAGTTSVRVASLPAEMKRLSARGLGEVVLAAPRDDGALKAGGDIFATMPNADMEAWQDPNNKREYCQTALGTYYNWKLSSRPAGWFYFLHLAHCKSGNGHWMIDGGTKSYFRYEDYPFQGNVVMAFKQGIVVENTVTFPQAGDYELTFLSAGRMTGIRGNDTYAGGQVKMSLVRNGVTNAIGTAMAYVENATRRQRFRVRGVEAGAYTFVLNHDVGTGDAHTILDDFRFRLITDPETETVVRPPNGDFERADIPFTSRAAFSDANTVADWTFASSGRTMSDVCVLTRGMTANAMFLDSANAWGGIQLALYGASAAITSSPFALPPGTWRLRCRMGGMYYAESSRKWNGNTTNRSRNLQAWLVADGVETSLGTTGSYMDPTMITVTFNAPITLTATKNVQLVIRQIGTDTTSSVACAVVDDVEFVQTDAQGEVLRETFESDAGWTFTPLKDGTAYTSKSEVIIRDPARALPTVSQTRPYAYGLTYGVNKKALEFCQCGTAEKQVTFPEAGTYRLDFSSRSRVWVSPTPSMNYSGNQLAFYLVDANNVTNEFYRSPSIYSTNFVFRSTLFTVPAAGTYTFGIRGLNGWPLEDGSHLWVGVTDNDVTAMVDQVLVRKADETRAPDIPETLALELSDGARLRLDFAGTNRIDRLRLNGKSVAGYIDASHPSGLVSGIGCLEVRPKGTVIMFR